ncbi:GNAT family N-acetyltransferase [Pacificibacter marinus]|uniref:GNAT family N-acetyltransferase n=1 Tax=Pacificibacter marinus TaxID=658057 RepID=UPI001C07B86C|nr:GNAT family N-acetyltransferase [Pacificibacter marinus]MBU2865587.1 GNAT family N-acetyltransferase [Pacificibacter marinus]
MQVQVIKAAPNDKPDLWLAQSRSLAQILVDSVAAGAAIGFMQPLSLEAAQAFWRDTVALSVIQGERDVLIAVENNTVLGTVQLVGNMPPNQPHRAEIAKMMVAPEARRKGIGRALMHAALRTAKGNGKTLVTLDTRTGDVAAPLYASVGFKVAGSIPDFAYDADGQALHGTTYMYCKL